MTIAPQQTHLFTAEDLDLIMGMVCSTIEECDESVSANVHMIIKRMFDQLTEIARTAQPSEAGECPPATNDARDSMTELVTHFVCELAGDLSKSSKIVKDADVIPEDLESVYGRNCLCWDGGLEACWLCPVLLV